MCCSATSCPCEPMRALADAEAHRDSWGEMWTYENLLFWLYCSYKCLVMALWMCEAHAWWLENTLMMPSLQSSAALSCTVLCKGYNEGFVNSCWKQGYVIRLSKLERQTDFTYSGEGSEWTFCLLCKILWNLGGTRVKLISLKSHLKCKYCLKNNLICFRNNLNNFLILH